MRVIVCGGRDYQDRARVFAALSGILKKHGQITIIQGGCKTGADLHARAFASCTKGIVHLINEEADWKTHGKAAGPIRNQAMLDQHSPEAVVAFPGGAGTTDMVHRAEEAGLKVWFPCGSPDAKQGEK